MAIQRSAHVALYKSDALFMTVRLAYSISLCENIAAQINDGILGVLPVEGCYWHVSSFLVGHVSQTNGHFAIKKRNCAHLFSTITSN